VNGIPGSDKPQAYLDLYWRLMPDTEREIDLLELGVATGGSLLYWADRYPHGRIVGLDLAPPEIEHPRIRTVRGDQGDPYSLDACGSHFDVIIDDCSHLGTLTEISYNHLWPKLAHGGIYAIEDWGTGYWSDWPDGAEYREGHTSGMVGVIKHLVDVVAWDDITRRSFHSAGTAGEIESMTIINGLAVLVKR
jgi:SAM-dependent methyltransferase